MNKRNPVGPEAEQASAAIRKADLVLGILKPVAESGGEDKSRIDALVHERNEARAARSFARADEIRDQLASEGIIIEDTKDGVRWFRQ